ncbi:MAG: hypothetical protein K6E36_08715 [Oscillospiraceae bacterium]|nr:hypothetical protein [Oscillospiraceae bacterium]
MKKQIMSIALSAVLVGSAVLPVSAEVRQAPDAAALLKQVQYGSYEQYTPISAGSGIMTPDGMPAVASVKCWEYAGIAFTCADADALAAAAPAAHPVLKSEGQYLNIYLPFCDGKSGAESEQFLMQPLTGYAEAFAGRWGDDPGMNTGTDGDILADFSGADGTVWLIASHPDNAEALVTWLCQQDVQILGVGYGTWEDTGWYDNIPPSVYAAPEAGYTLSAEDFGEYAAAAVPVENSPFGYWRIDLPVELSYEEAQAICNALEQNPKISYAAHQPNAFMSEPNPDHLRVELVAPADADVAEQYDIAAYVEEHFRRSDGAAVHFLDPTGWFSGEITKQPDYRKLEGTAYLFTDDFGEKFSAGDWAGSLTYLTAYSYFYFDLADLSDEAAAAFDAILNEFAASRETLVYTHDQRANPQLNDYALRTDTPDLLTAALNAQPDVKALISQIHYTPVFVDTVSLRTDNGLQFMLTEGVPADALQKLAADLKKNWTVTDDNHITPDTVTTESLVDIIATVSAAYPVTPMLSPLDNSSKGIALLGDLDGDGQITAYDASLALTGFNEATVLGLEPSDRTLTPAQEALADVDGDGALTAFDATCILTYTNLKYNAGFDDLTWEDVLPNP